MPSLGTRIGFVALLISIVGVVWLAQRTAGELSRFRTDDPTAWESAIAAFESAAHENPPSPEAVLFLGASTIRFWNTIEEDMAPLPAIGRGFGGAKLGDVLYYAERLIEPRPRAVVVAVGVNDLFAIAGNKASSPEQVAGSAQRLLTRLLDLAPGMPVYYVAIRPPILDPDGRDPSSKANARIRGFAESTHGIGYIDANPGMYQPDGRLREEYRAWDRSQLSPKGYQAWAAPIRDRLLRDLGT